MTDRGLDALNIEIEAEIASLCEVDYIPPAGSEILDYCNEPVVEYHLPEGCVRRYTTPEYEGEVVPREEGRRGFLSSKK